MLKALGIYELPIRKKNLQVYVPFNSSSECHFIVTSPTLVS